MDRNDAGRQLAGLLSAFRGHDVVVLALPGGGVRVAHEIAARLRVLLDVILVQPLAVARCPDLVYGLLGEEHTLLIDTAAVARGELCDEEREHTEQLQSKILRHSAFSFRGEYPRLSLEDRTVVIVDECLTEAGTVRDACRMARMHGAIRVAVAVPVAGRQALSGLSPYADKIVCLHAPAQSPTAGHWYRDGAPTTSTDIASMLGTNHSAVASDSAAAAESAAGFDGASRITPASRSTSMRGRWP
ncbi:phosphoribosyltransferase [Nocardia sp. NBC_01327]|uniref:phosphoribosyltransferase n=1 Tax=Nocardia sp. NBC_01327 TaxID=2903593 RepID=UPI002E13B59C|nr:phosphoribosyltransferase family protein [Nocardia sp. NBC_01327]